MRTSTASVIKVAAIVVAVALVPVLIWVLFDVILITMGAVLIAVLLRLGAEPFERWFKVPERPALAISGILIVGLLGVAFYLFGTQMASELHDVFERAKQAQQNIMNMLQGSDIGKFMLSHVHGSSLSVTDVLTRVFSLSANFIEAVVVMVFTGIYIAAQPRLYRIGLIKLFPPEQHNNAAETFEDIGNALRLWLLGQLIQMVIIGGLSATAAWLIGLPSPMALGLISGVAEFVPYIGPIIGAIPAVLVAATQGMPAVLWTLLAYTIIHQTEGHVLVPIIQRRMVYIPPAVILLGVVAISFLFGMIALLFAAPIVVIIFVAVKKLYIRDTLGEKVAIPGETQ